MEDYCVMVTASNDGFIKMWKLHLKEVCLKPYSRYMAFRVDEAPGRSRYTILSIRRRDLLCFQSSSTEIQSDWSIVCYICILNERCI